MLNYTYDYLKSASIVKRSTDVRYLTGLKKALRDRLRDIIDDTPAVCPQIQSRYILHKRRYHDNSSNHPSKLSKNNIGTQAHLPLASIAVPNMVHRTSSNVTHNGSDHTTCFCLRPKPCVCESKTRHELKDYKTDKDEKETQKLLNEVNDWIMNIPVYPNFNPQDKIRQEQIANELTNTLKKLKHQTHFNFKAKSEILKCLNNLPMWHPSDLKDDTLFKEQLADNLIQKVAQMAESDFEEEIIKGIKALPFDNKSINSEDTKRIAQKFLQRLKPIAVNRPQTDANYKEALKSELVNLIQELPLQYSTVYQKSDVANDLADKFANQLYTIKLPANKQTTLDDSENVLQNKILDWCKNMPEFSKIDTHQYNNLVQLLTNKIREYDVEDLEDNNISQKMQEDIKDWLDKTAVTINKHLDTKTKNKYSNKLIQLLKKPGNNRNESKSSSEGFSEKQLVFLKGWFEGIPELQGGDESKNEESLKNLATLINEIQSREENIDGIQGDMREVITNWLQNMFRKKHETLDSVTQENLVNRIVLKLNEMESGDIFYTDVLTWLDHIPGIKSNINIDQNSAISKFVSTLNNIRNNDDENLVEKQTKDAVKKFTEAIFDKIGLPFNEKEQKLLEQTVLKRMNVEPQQRKRWNKEINMKQDSDSIQLYKEMVSSTPKAYALHHYSLPRSKDVSPIRNVSLEETYLNDPDYTQYINKLNSVINSWIKELDLMIDNQERNILVHDITTDIVDRQKYLQLSEIKTSEFDELEHLKYQIFRRFNKLKNLADLSKIISKVNDLNNNILTLKVPALINQSRKHMQNNDLNLTENIDSLVNSLKTWLYNIRSAFPRLSISSKTNADEVILELAENIAKLEVNKNHDFYLNNEIFEWLPKIFNRLDINMLNMLTESLINHLLNDHFTRCNEAQKDMTGTLYRKLLWDTMSKTLPSIQNSSADDLLTFNLLKERLVDAFINLHYFSEDNNMFHKFSDKLIDQVNKFCNEYLKRYPETPLNSEELSKKLYNALKTVSVPNIESIRSELEQVRLKEEIFDWLQNVPLNKPLTIDSQMNIMISGLAKQLHGLETDKILEPNKNKNSEMKLEIMKWLQKLPIKDDEIMNLHSFADNLVEKLKSTDKSRTLNTLKARRYSDNITSTLRRDTMTQYTPQFPQSTLTSEDRAHLDRIRKRIDISQGDIRPTCKDASVNPPPKETGIQTEANRRTEGTVQTSRTSLIERSSLNREISPQVIVKEYYWDSHGSNQSLPMNTFSPQKLISPSTQIDRSEPTPQRTRIKTSKTANSQTGDVSRQTLEKTTRPPPPRFAPRNPKCDCEAKQVGKIFDKRTCSLGSFDNDRIIPSAIRPPFYFPEDKRVGGQQSKLTTEGIGARSGREDVCCNCGQRMLTKCRGRPYSGCRQNYNLRLKHCSNCCSGCPYPSYLFFRKEF